jgi:hypothetical protein
MLSFLMFSCAKPDDQEMPDKTVIPEAVDLGLSVKWASFDVGATKPGEIGEYFAWGETESKTAFFWKNYSLCNGTYSSLTKYNFRVEYGYPVDYRYALKPEDDVAHVRYGEGWRIPTLDEIKELIECPFLTLSLETVNKITCLKVTSDKTGKSILFPPGGSWVGAEGSWGGSGLYWSSEIDYSPYPVMMDAHNPTYAYFLQATPIIESGLSSLSKNLAERFLGMSIRAVHQ